ncbi:MAG: putative sulfate exporter family transporter [Candidatus Acidiferrales bacterium]
MHKNFVVAALFVAASALISPALALLLGLFVGLALANPFHCESKRFAKILLQASVVALGFGMNMREVVHVGRSGFLYTALSITGVMLFGLALGYFFQVNKRSSFLITAGTAICGGSAIAAVGPLAGANEEEMAVSLGTVFILNSVALFLFPMIGWTLHLTQTQFGLWAALAIHDTSSVVGATAKYGPTALAVGTTVKLARALWILPLSVLTSVLVKNKAKIQVPWFIPLFCLAAVLNSAFPHLRPEFMVASKAGKIGLSVTLFLIGASLSRESLKRVGTRPLLQGLLLWIVVGTATLSLILLHWIHG